MKYIVALWNIAHQNVELIISNYDYHIREIVYPYELREKYPGPDENKHQVITRVPNTPENLERLVHTSPASYKQLVFGKTFYIIPRKTL